MYSLTLRTALQSRAMAALDGAEEIEWDAFMQTLVSQYQQQEVQEEKLFEPRSDSGVSMSQVPTPQAPRLWWARLLKEHTTFKMCGYGDSSASPSPVTLVSGCSGIFSEAEVLKASHQQTVWLSS